MIMPVVTFVCRFSVFSSVRKEPTCGLTVSEEFTLKGESCDMCLMIMRVHNYVHNKYYVTYSGFQLLVVKTKPNHLLT